MSRHIARKKTVWPGGAWLLLASFLFAVTLYMIFMSVSSSNKGGGSNVVYPGVKAPEGYSPDANFYKAVNGTARITDPQIAEGYIPFSIDTGKNPRTSNSFREAFLSLAIPSRVSNSVDSPRSTLGLQSKTFNAPPLVFSTFAPTGAKADSRVTTTQYLHTGTTQVLNKAALNRLNASRPPAKQIASSRPFDQGSVDISGKAPAVTDIFQFLLKKWRAL